MHPPRALRVVVLLLVLGAGAWVVGNRPGGWTAVLERFNLLAEDPSVIEASGFMEADRVELASELGGRVAAVLVEEGEEVASGQVLVRLDGELLAAQLDQAVAAVEGARARLELVTAGPPAAELEVARAQLGQAEARRDGAREALGLLQERLDALPEGAPTGELEGQIQATETELSVAEAAVGAARARLEGLLAGPRSQEVRAAAAQLAQAEGAARGLEVQLERLAVRAPRSGRVGQVLIREGELATPGQALVTLTRPDPLELVLFVPEDRIGRVAVGQPVEVRVDSHPDRIFGGRVVHVAEEAEFTPRSVQSREERVNLVFAVRVEVPNPSGALKPGMPADARLRSGE